MKIKILNILYNVELFINHMRSLFYIMFLIKCNYPN